MVPRIDRDPAKLDPEFRRIVEVMLAELLRDHWLYGIQEGFRTVERQAFIYEQGRTRTGPIVTQKDGVTRLSNHQSGRAADIYPKRNGMFYIPRADALEWVKLGEAAERNGLIWGGRYPRMKDMPHVELRRVA